MKSRIYDSAIDPSGLLVVTDLDGTLLDFDDYSFDAAKPALNMLKKSRVPVVCCSSKTSGEVIAARKKLRINDPFISENGAAVYLPENQFGSLKGRFERRKAHGEIC